MSVSLTAKLVGPAVHITFGDHVVARIPLTEDQRSHLDDTFMSRDDTTAEVAATWLTRRLNFDPYTMRWTHPQGHQQG